jgi:hypothetical protein
VLKGFQLSLVALYPRFTEKISVHIGFLFADLESNFVTPKAFVQSAKSPEWNSSCS